MSQKRVHLPLLVLILALAAFATTAEPVRELDVVVFLDDDALSAPGLEKATAAGPLARHAYQKSRARDLAAEHRVTPSRTYGTVLRGFAARVSQSQLEDLRRDPRVERIEYDGIAWGTGFPVATKAKPGSGPPAPQEVPWGIDRVGAAQASNTGAGVIVYVFDTGIDLDHPDLAANISSSGWAGYTCKGNQCLEDWDDDNGHGTHVAGTIGAIDNTIQVIGVAPDVTLVPVKVLHKSNSGAWSVIAAGVDWAAADMAARGGPAVANMSIGGLDSNTGTCTLSGFSGTGLLHEALCNAKNMGMIMSVSAGNSGADSQGEIPASFDDTVMAVSATFEGDDWIDWSNWGDDAAGWTSHDSAPVAIAAPGVGVLSTINGGGTAVYNGTSMASPHVAGTLAIFLAGNPQAADGTAFENARAALLGNAESTVSFSNTSGHPHDEDFVDTGAF